MTSQPKPHHKPAAYKHVAAWGDFLSSFAYYIRDEQQRAAADGAPVDAIFKRDDGTWAVIGDVHPSTIVDMRSTLARYDLPTTVTITRKGAIDYALGHCPHGKFVKKDCSTCMSALPKSALEYIDDVAAGKPNPGAPREPMPHYAKRPWAG